MKFNILSSIFYMRSFGYLKKLMQKLHGIIKNIYKSAKEAAEEYGTPGNLVNGANIAGFLKAAKTMMAQGLV